MAAMEIWHARAEVVFAVLMYRVPLQLAHSTLLTPLSGDPKIAHLPTHRYVSLDLLRLWLLTNNNRQSLSSHLVDDFFPTMVFVYMATCLLKDLPSTTAISLMGT